MTVLQIRPDSAGEQTARDTNGRDRASPPRLPRAGPPRPPPLENSRDQKYPQNAPAGPTREQRRTIQGAAADSARKKKPTRAAEQAPLVSREQDPRVPHNRGNSRQKEHPQDPPAEPTREQRMTDQEAASNRGRRKEPTGAADQAARVPREQVSDVPRAGENSREQGHPPSTPAQQGGQSRRPSERQRRSIQTGDGGGESFIDNTEEGRSEQTEE